MRKTVFYVITQQTSVDKYIYEDKAKLKFNNEDGYYFPLEQ